MEVVVPEDPLAQSPARTRDQQSDSETEHSQSTPPFSSSVAMVHGQLKSVSLERIRVHSLRSKPQGSSRKSALSKRKKRAANIVPSGESSSSESDTPTQPLTEGIPDGVPVQKGGDRVSQTINETDVKEVEGVECVKDFPPRDIDRTPPLSDEKDKDAAQQTDTDATVDEMASDYEIEIAPEDATAIESTGKPCVPASDLSASAHREESGKNSVETSREETARLDKIVSEKSNPCREISISVETLHVPVVQVREGVSVEAWEPVPESRTREVVTPRERSSALSLRRSRKRDAKSSMFPEQTDSIQPNAKKAKVDLPQEQQKQAAGDSQAEVGGHLLNKREMAREASPSEEHMHEEAKTNAAANPEDVQNDGVQNDGWASMDVDGILCSETKRPKLEPFSHSQEKSTNVLPTFVQGETKLLEATSSKRSDEPNDQSGKLPRPTKDGALKKTIELKLQRSNVLQHNDAIPVDGSSLGGDHRAGCKPVEPALQHPHQSSTNARSSQVTASKLPIHACARDRKPGVRKIPPPSLFAPPGVPPADYTSVILQSFDSYFTQLLAAQRKQLHRIAWGKPVMSDRRQPSHTLDWKGPRRQQKRQRSEHNLILSTVKTTAAVSTPSSSRSTESPLEYDDAGTSIPSSRVTASTTPTLVTTQNTGSTERNEIEPQRTLESRPTLSPKTLSTTTPSRRGKLSLGRRSFRSGDTGLQENRDAGMGTSTGQASHDNREVFREGQSAGRTPQKDLANTRSRPLRPSRLHEFHDSDDDFEAAAPARVPTPIAHRVRADRFPPRTETDDIMEITPSVTPSPPPQSIQALSEDQRFLRNSPCSQKSHLSTAVTTPDSNSPGENVILGKRTKATHATGRSSDSSDGSDSSASGGGRPTAKDDEWINPKASRSRATVPSGSNRRGKRGRGITRGRRKKAHFVEDSESDSDGKGDGIAPQKALERNIAKPLVTGNISDILGTSTTPATCTRSSAKPQKLNTTSAKLPPNVSSPSLSPSPSPSPPSPSSNLFSGTTGGRRQKRDYGQFPRGQTGRRQTAAFAAKGVIDLTEDTQQSRQSAYSSHYSGSPSQEFDDDEVSGDPHVSCPICQKHFPGSEIEAHAAQCGDEGNYSDSDQSLPPVDVGMSSVAATRPTRQTTAPLRTMGTVAGVETIEEFQTIDSGEEGEGQGEGEEEWVDDGAGGSEDDSTDSEGDQLSSRWDAPEVDSNDDPSLIGGIPSAPQLLPCEGGGFIVDPSTVSSSPIRTFKKIKDLAPHERDSYRNQFNYSKSGRGRGRSRQSIISGGGMLRRPNQANTWGRDDFDELVAGSSGLGVQHSSRSGYRGSRRRGGARGRRGARGRTHSYRGGQKWRGQKSNSRKRQ